MDEKEVEWYNNVLPLYQNPFILFCLLNLNRINRTKMFGTCIYCIAFTSVYTCTCISNYIWIVWSENCVSIGFIAQYWARRTKRSLSSLKQKKWNLVLIRISRIQYKLREILTRFQTAWLRYTYTCHSITPAK